MELPTLQPAGRRAGVRETHRDCTRCGKELLLWPFFVPLVLVAVGCGGPRGPKVEYVEGTVTLDGSPVEGASVGYSPINRAVGLPAAGKTDAKGRYRLTAVGGGKQGAGTVIGDYAVSITKLEIVPADEPQPPPPAWWKPSMGDKPAPLRSVTPEVYGESATSGLRVAVKAGRNTGPEFSFDLRADFRGLGK